MTTLVTRAMDPLPAVLAATPSGGSARVSDAPSEPTRTKTSKSVGASSRRRRGGARGGGAAGGAGAGASPASGRAARRLSSMRSTCAPSCSR